MENRTIKKYMVIGIMFLFIGASVLPIISGATQNLNNMINSGTLAKKHQPKAHQSSVGNQQRGKDATTHAKVNQTHDSNVKAHPDVKPTEQKPSVRDMSNSGLALNSKLQSFLNEISINMNKNKAAVPFAHTHEKIQTLQDSIQGNSPQTTSGMSVNSRGGGAQPLGGSVHNINTGLSFDTIQAAIDDESTSNGDLITVDPGTYDESVHINKEITLKSNSSQPVIDALGADFGIWIDVNNVTVDNFNITDTRVDGIFCDVSSGFTLVNNTFWYDPWGIYYSDVETGPSSHYRIFNNAVRGNVFFMDSSNAAVLVYISLDYNFGSSTTLTMGNLGITDNTFFMNGTQAFAIDLFPYYSGYGGIYAFNMNDSSISVGTVDISRNTIYGGDAGAAFMAGFFELNNVQLNTGDILIHNNTMTGQSIAGIMCFPYGGTDWHGTTHGLFGKVSVQGNTMSSGSSDFFGIALFYASMFGGGFYNYTGTASLTTGDVLVQNNTIDTAGGGIVFEMYNAGGYSDTQGMYDHSSLTLGDFIFTDNMIYSENYPDIVIDVDYCGYYMYDYSSVTLGSFQVMDNTLTGTNDGIYIGHFGLPGSAQTGGGIYELGYEMYDHSKFSMNNIKITGNSIDVACTGTYGAGIYIDYIGDFGEEMHNYSSFTMGYIKVDSNTIRSSINDTEYGAAIYAYIDDFGYDMFNNAVFTMGDVTFDSNILTILGSGGIGTGLYINFIGDFGENMGNSASFTMGDIHVDNNHINTTLSASGNGIYAEYSDFGEELSNNAVVHMGDVTFNSNVIQTNNMSGYGIELYDFDWFGNDMYNNSIFTMGDLQIDNNTIHSFDEGLQLGNYSYEEWEGVLGWFGVYMSGHAQATMGNIEANDNHITSIHSDGIYVDYEYYGSFLEDYAKFTMGDITFNNNVINCCYQTEITDNISDTVHLARGYYEGLYNAVTEKSYQYGYSPDNTEWSNVLDAPVADPTVLTYTDWRDAVGGNPPSMVGKVIYMHIISEDRYFEMDFTSWTQGGGGGFSYTRYELVHNEGWEVGEGVTFTRPNSAWGTSMYLDYIGDIGYDMLNNSKVTVGNLETDYNNVSTGGGNGIYIDYSEYGYNMGETGNDHCVFTMGDITCNYNTIKNSGSEGIYTSDVDDFGSYMFGSSTYTMRNIQFNHNDITTIDSSGLELSDPERYGCYMYNNSQYTMGNLEANDNTIYAGDGNGIYMYYDEFGYHMGEKAGDHCVFVMGDITCNDNSITNSGSEGIYVDDLYEIGYEMYGSSTCTIGNIEFDRNWINTSDDSGLYFDYIGEIGYDMYNTAHFTMGYFSTNDNNIQAGDGYGIYIEWSGMGENMGSPQEVWNGEGWTMVFDPNAACVFTMGDLTFNNNTIKNNGSEGIYTSDLDDFGEDMYGSSTFTMGNIQFNHNTIETGDDSGLYLSDPEYFGDYMYNNSQCHIGSLEADYNTITAGDGNGIYMYYNTFGYRMGLLYEDLGTLDGSGDVNAHCIFTMGDITCNNNNIINSGSDGIYVERLDHIGSYMGGYSTATIGNITFNHNHVHTNGSHSIGISNYYYENEGMYDIGYELHNHAKFAMGNIQINDNMLNATWPGYGINISWLGQIGVGIYDDSQATFGSIEINNNYLNDGWGDGIIYNIGYIGDDLYNNATVTVRHITMNNNNVVSSDDGITDRWSGDFGTNVYDNARYYGEELILAYNTINTANDGIRILGGTYGLIVGANTILNAGQGIDVKQDSNNLVVAYNTMSGTLNDGILFDSTYDSMIVGNFINASQNKNGIDLTNGAHNITIVRNTVSNNSDTGINVTLTYNNLIYHNNILDNTLQAYDDSEGPNMWDNGYPSGGNYWSDYIGHDNFNGPNQNIAGSDGIGDTPYNITHPILIHKDHYPFMHGLTINHPSLYTPSDPSPADGATGVSITTDLSWTGGDPDNDYNNYDVYFGTTNPPTYLDTIYLTNQTRISYHPGTLVTDTTYYWQIIAWNPSYNETASGPVWEFYTGSPPSGAPPVPNHYAPTADPDGPYNGDVNTPVQFDGTGSHTNGNDGSTIVAYDWSFFAGDPFHNLGPTPTHTYDTAGTYNVSLRVTDSEDGIGIGSTLATIRSVNTPPNTPIIAGPTTGNVNAAYTYSVTATDPDNNNIEYVIDWGDGSAKTTSAFMASGESYTASHAWAASGAYTIKVYAEDIYGGISGTATYLVIIGTATAPPPVHGYIVNGSFHNNDTGLTTKAQQQADGTWLIDVNGDGTWDYVYNSVTGTYTPYSPAPSPGLPGPLIWGGAALIIIILLILFFLLWRRRKKDEEEEEKK